MDADEIQKLIGRAKSVAIKWGYPKLADDFAQEVFIAISTGSHPKLEWLFIDFLRREYGDSRTISGRIRQLAEKFATRLDAPISEDGNSELNHGFIGCVESSAEPVEHDRRHLLDYQQLRGREREFAILNLQEEWTHEKIAEFYGITQGRVSQVISLAQQKLKTYAEYNDFKEKIEMDELKLEFKL